MSPVVQEVHAPSFIFSIINPSVYGKNYSLTLGQDSFLCVPGASYSSSQFVFGISTSCMGAVNANINNYQSTGAGGLLIAGPAFTADAYALTWFYDPPIQNTPAGYETWMTRFPVFFVTYLYNGDVPIDSNPLYWKTIYVWLLTKQNVSFFLDQPSQNLMFEAQFLVPNFGGFVMYFGQAFWIFMMCFATVKIVQFFALDPSFAFSLPKLILMLVLYSSFWGYIEFNFGPVSYWGHLDQRFALLTHSWPGPPAISGMVLLAFYFGEISMLTSKPDIPGLSKFKIPAICVCGIIFLSDYICGGIAAARPVSAVPTYLFQVWAYMFMAVYSLVFLLVLWGLISLARALSSTQGAGRNAVQRVLVTGCFLLFFILCGITQWILLLRASFYACNNTLLWFFVLFWVLGPGGICITLLLTFRVSVQKEIEISKSATSSTSSSMTSKSGSSSSASSASMSEPVIEL